MCSDSTTNASVCGPVASTRHPLVRLPGRTVSDCPTHIEICRLKTCELSKPVYLHETPPLIRTRPIRPCAGHDLTPPGPQRSLPARRLPRSQAAAGGAGRRHARLRGAGGPSRQASCATRKTLDSARGKQPIPSKTSPPTTTSTNSAPKRAILRGKRGFAHASMDRRGRGVGEKPPAFDIDELLEAVRSKSASTACAASKAGRW